MRIPPHSPLPLHPTPSAPSADAKLRAACNDFEALFLAQMLEASASGQSRGILGGDVADNVLRSQFNDALSRTMSRRGALGIGEILYHQLSTTRGRPAK